MKTLISIVLMGILIVPGLLKGQSDVDGSKYRISGGKEFQILNPGEKILLYKTSSGTGLKNDPKVEHYYFSAEAGSEILALTLRNVETVFESNTAFEERIEMTFRNDGDLTMYDPIHKMYKLNRLMQMSNVKPLVSIARQQ
ncbi:MAG: hypothetical protein ACHQRM_15620 [Bacteroidia bacterium]